MLNDRLMTLKEVADLLNVSEITVRRYTKKGIIPSFKIGAVVRYDPNEISKVLAAYRRGLV